MNFNVRQKQVIDAEENKILCLATAACGKTRVLTERVRVLIEEKNVKPEDIVAITFTNMAAEEMKDRLGTIGEKCFIGTIHSYANSICMAAGIDTRDFIAREQFDKILLSATKVPTSKLKTIENLLIDECQDLSPTEYNFLNHLVYKNIFYVGDNRQAIYSFRGCTDAYLENMAHDSAFKKYFLNENYRNAPNIVEFADDLLATMPQLSPKSKPVKQADGYVTRCSAYEAFEELEASANWGSWFVLTRTNKELDKTMEVLESKGIPCVTFKKADMNQALLEQVMKSNRVKVLTIHMSKGLERKNVIVIGAKTFNLDERKIAYVAATRAENNLYWCPTIVTKGRQYKNRSAFTPLDKDMVEF